jgi:hypothetical protein
LENIKKIGGYKKSGSSGEKLLCIVTGAMMM